MRPVSPPLRRSRHIPCVLAVLILSTGSAFAGIDGDGDGLADQVDNCIAEPNGPSIADAGGNVQLDTDADGFGNACDGDFNQDGFVGGPDFTLFLACLNAPATSDLCRAADMDGSGIVDAADHILFLRVFNGPPGPSSAPLTSVASSSPSNGEIGVAITRETIFRFSAPLGGGAVTSNIFFASFAGAPLAARIHVSPDRKVVTLFYDDPLPASARIRVSFDGDAVMDTSGRPVDADGDGIAGGRALVDFDTLALVSFPNTAVFGRVFASELTPDADGGLTVNEPLEGVRISVDGKEDSLFAVTDANGDFRLEPAPAGRFFVHIDGSTAINGVEPGAFYPFVGKAWQSEAGIETDIGNVYLPLILPDTLQAVSIVQETVITFPDAVLADFPEFSLVSLTVPADSLYSDDGTRGGMVGIAPVPPDRLPGDLPPGLHFPIVITVQTDGATNFDTPVPVCFPNLPDPDTGITPQPGDESALWSFNHDTGRFEVVGPATVSADGTLICTDPGVGILAPGWHGTEIGTRGDGGETKKEDGGSDDDEAPATCSPPGTPKKVPCNKCKNKAEVGDPVRPFSGEFYLDVEDLRIKGRGIDFIWSRNYRSRVGRNTAQGNSWDYSYQIRIEADGTDIALFDGGSRSDVYAKQAAPDLWTKEELFRSLVRNPDGSYSLIFEDQGRWEFNPLNGSIDQGKINQSIDRFGNALAFAYDGSGRLATITDTLGRDIVLQYDLNGFIESITDFAGRVVSYAYYDGIEPGGSFGDLKSVTTPAVTGTPNGNDFPNGKTTTYTYSTGFSDPRLNHNLLTITDGRRNDPLDATFGDGPYLVNSYGNSSDPDNIDFDRITRQTWGNAGDVIDFSYVPIFPSNVNGMTVMKTITNDRVGNVIEYFWDASNRLIRQREYTGRADPDLPTSEIANRPTGKLRASDPEFFETIWEYNEDALESRIIHPNGNITEKVYESDLDPNASPFARANLRIIRSLPGSHTPAGDQAVIEERLEYGGSFGSGCCGLNFVTKKTDARGNSILYEYDAQGNLIQLIDRIASIEENFEFNQFGQQTAQVWPDNGSGHRRRDEYSYYQTGPQRGYVEREIRDAGVLARTTSYEYDIVGNLVRVIDPRGNDTLYVVNALNQRVRQISREVTPGSGIRYERDLYYDANDNLIRVDDQNVDDAGVVQANSHFTTSFEFEILDNPVREIREVTPSHNVVTEYAYDANRNRTEMRYGEATNGNQPANIVRMIYDERNMLFQETRAPGDLDQSTMQIDYDPNGNRIRVSFGIEDVPKVQRITYDGYDRPVAIADAMGNIRDHSYDSNHNLLRLSTFGQLSDVPGSIDNVLLAESTTTYDAMDRPILRSDAHFATLTGAPVGDGASQAETFYSDNSQITRTVNDNGNEAFFRYDTLNRMTLVTDAVGNTTETTYDANDNPLRIVATEKSELGSPDEVFITSFIYDGLNRMIGSEDNSGNLNDYAYDSRSNRTLVSDPRRSGPDQPGNITRYEFDGLNRLVQTTRLLTLDGTGAGAPAGQIVQVQEWDDSSRLVAHIDDNGNRTETVFDALDRTVATVYADTSVYTYEYDVHGNATRMTDANGNVIVDTFDLLDRRTGRSVTPGSSVSSDTTFETFEYDGMSRLVGATDDDSTVDRSYDSLEQLMSETLNGQTLFTSYDGVGNLLLAQYPGGRLVSYSYDALERVDTVSDQGGLIAAFDYIGPNRLERRTNSNGTHSLYDYDGSQRTTRTSHVATPGGVFDQRLYGWDAANNRTSVTDELGVEQTHTYAYDSVHRLVSSVETPPGGGPGTITDYEFDGVDNRISVSGPRDPGSYTRDISEPEPADEPVNQYTTTSFDVRQYDANGNLVVKDDAAVGERQLVYDYQNRMTRHTDTGTGEVATYRYDALGRRIERAVDDGSLVVTRYFYTEMRVCEEQDVASATTATYVYGSYIDDPISMQRNSDEFFFHADDQFNVVKVTDLGGAVVESYQYADYGMPSIFDAGGSPLQDSAVGNPYFFAGRRFDTESDLYYNRLRYLDPRAGRFTVRDPVGSWTDGTNRGNGFGYVGASPHSALDPFGLWSLGRWILTGDGNAENEVYDAAKTQFQETLWDRTDATVRTLSLGHADAMSVTRVFTPSTWGQETGETSHVFDPLEQAKAECFARCWAEKVCDAFVGLAMDKYNAKLPIPFSACSGVKGLLVDKDLDAGVSRNEVAWTNWVMEKAAKGRIADLKKLKKGKDTVLHLLRRDLVANPGRGGFSGGGGRLSNKQIRRRIEGLADFDKQIGKAKMLEKAGIALGGAALAYELYNCFQDCESDPCSH